MFLLLNALLVAATPHGLAEEPSREYVLKAAYVYRITQFVDWPREEEAERARPLGLCILGEDPFGRTIDYIEEKQSKGRPFSLRRLAEPEGLTSCHVVFISASESGRLGAILEGLEGSSVLTIGDLEGFAESGGTIGLVVSRKGKVGLEINLRAAEEAGLQISAKLLELAEIVDDERRRRR